MINEFIILTKYDGAILGPIARVLGFIIDAIFKVLNKIGIPNIGLAIILFTIIIYLLLLPLVFKQQKFAKMSAVMNPEIRAVQEKYKGKKDSESMQKQNEELQKVYSKYGVSPAGSCVQLLIQMPILFALYRVIYNIPAYITQVKDSLVPVAEKIISHPDGISAVSELEVSKLFPADKFDYSNVDTIIDILNRASTNQWEQLKTSLSSISDAISQAHETFTGYNYFLGINIADSPSDILSMGWADKNWVLIIGALAVPVLAALSQWLNILFMPQQNNGKNDDNPMAASMKSMNIMMPVMSAIFCFTLPAGMGIYWIASAVVRCFQQVGINKYFDRIGLDKIIEDNMKKAEKKQEKVEKLTASSGKVDKKMLNNVKNLPSVSAKQGSYKKGSLAEKANLVSRFSDSHDK